MFSYGGFIARSFLCYRFYKQLHLTIFILQRLSRLTLLGALGFFPKLVRVRWPVLVGPGRVYCLTSFYPVSVLYLLLNAYLIAFQYFIMIYTQTCFKQSTNGKAGVCEIQVSYIKTATFGLLAFSSHLGSSIPFEALKIFERHWWDLIGQNKLVWPWKPVHSTAITFYRTYVFA